LRSSAGEIHFLDSSIQVTSGDVIFVLQAPPPYFVFESQLLQIQKSGEQDDMKQDKTSKYCYIVAMRYITRFFVPETPGTGSSHLDPLWLASLCGEIHLFVAGTFDTT